MDDVVQMGHGRGRIVFSLINDQQVDGGRVPLEHADRHQLAADAVPLVLGLPDSMRHACITTSAQYTTPPSDLARPAAAVLPVPPIWDQG
jgi:hypothetical protein